MQFLDGGVSNVKNSTLFPAGWSDAQSLSAIWLAGNTTPIATRASDGAALYQATVNGVNVEVIKIGKVVTAGYPAGTKGFQSANYFLTGKN